MAQRRPVTGIAEKVPSCALPGHLGGPVKLRNGGPDWLVDFLDYFWPGRAVGATLHLALSPR